MLPKVLQIEKRNFPPMSKAWIPNYAPSFWSPDQIKTFPLPLRLAVLREDMLQMRQKSQSGHLGANFCQFAPLRDQGHLLRKKLHALRPLLEALATAVNSDDIR